MLPCNTIPALYLPAGLQPQAHLAEARAEVVARPVGRLIDCLDRLPLLQRALIGVRAGCSLFSTAGAEAP
eukprot:4433236-Alexandrium_andersonii.AAC.1